ncbi:MAG TPA: helix-turn-helix domain-containing protein [Streptosporangiaceae bacterium]|nr:helix-turn-helix domain-containing protein [Gaiellales bacterium]
MATAGQPRPVDPPRPMRADARRNFERLVAAAQEAFGEHGADAPLDDIARRAGVGAGTLYRHFPTREALLEAAYRADIDDLAKLAYELLDKLPPEEALRTWVSEQVEYVMRKRALAATVKAVLDRDSPVMAWCKTQMRGAAAALLARAQEAGVVRPEVTPSDLLRLAHAVGYASEFAPEDSDRLLTYMLDGLRPQPT